MLNYPILDYTGRLKRSLTRDFSPQFARIGANAYYAQVQQEGGRAHNGFWSRRPPYSTEPFSSRIGKIIPRPFLGVGKKLTRVCVRYLPKKSEKLSTDSIFL